MRTLLIPAALAAILSASPLALAAATHTAIGTIKAYDGKAMTLTLSDGEVFSLPQTFKDPGLKAGGKVQVSWDQSGAKKMAETVKIMK